LGGNALQQPVTSATSSYSCIPQLRSPNCFNTLQSTRPPPAKTVDEISQNHHEQDTTFVGWIVAQKQFVKILMGFFAHLVGLAISKTVAFFV
jgi:hypothetical protein